MACNWKTLHFASLFIDGAHFGVRFGNGKCQMLKLEELMKCNNMKLKAYTRR